MIQVRVVNLRLNTVPDTPCIELVTEFKVNGRPETQLFRVSYYQPGPEEDGRHKFANALETLADTLRLHATQGFMSWKDENGDIHQIQQCTQCGNLKKGADVNEPE